MDILGLVAEEASRQRETLPRAVRRVSYRVTFYYVAAVFVLGLNISVQDPVLYNIAQGGWLSPFVLMVERAGLPKMKNFVNAIILVGLTSTANTRLYVSVHVLSYDLTNNRVEHWPHWQMRAKRLVFLVGEVNGTSHTLACLPRPYPPCWHLHQLDRLLAPRMFLHSNCEKLNEGLRRVATTVNYMRGRFMGDYLRNVFAISSYCRLSRNERRYPS